MNTKECIAVIGMGCKVDKCISPDNLWELLTSGRNNIRPFPKERWHPSFDDYFKSHNYTDIRSQAQPGCFVQNIESLDNEFFGINNKEANSLDPQHRLLLQTTWHALEHASIRPSDIKGSKTGVFIGVSSFDHALLTDKHPNAIHGYSALGNSFALASNRLSYLFDLRGPSMTIDAACASSLVCIHLACQSLLRKETTLALAGGVNAILAPTVHASFLKAGLLSDQGYCKCFDDSADGYIRSEGCGVVVLKRLSDAIENNDQIVGLIHGSAVNQDGCSSSITSPNRDAQVNVIKGALDVSEIDSARIKYIEAHSTGTRLGDRLEMEALYEVFGESRSDLSPLIVGSLKSNIGHTEAAAGVLSLIKTLLIAKTKSIPANLHFSKPQSRIAHIFQKIKVPVSTIQFNEPDILCGISAFGFGGTNCHMIVGSYQAETALNDSPKPGILTISAKSREALKTLLELYLDAANSAAYNINDFLYTSNTGRQHFNFRYACVASTRKELVSCLEHAISNEFQPAEIRKKRGNNICVITGNFSLVGSPQRSGILLEPVARQCWDDLNRILLSETSFTLDDVGKSEQPAYNSIFLYAMQCATWLVYESWGLTAAAICMQHGSELTGLVIAGTITPAQGLMLLLGKPCGDLAVQLSEYTQKGNKPAIFSERFDNPFDLTLLADDQLKNKFQFAEAKSFGPEIPDTYLALHLDTGALETNNKLLRLETGLNEACTLLGVLYCHGINLDWNKITFTSAYKCSALPLYPFVNNGLTYIHPPVETETVEEITPAPEVGKISWTFDTSISVSRYRFLQHHQIGGVIVIPGTLYLSIIKESISNCFSKKIAGFNNLAFLNPVFIHDEASAKISFSLTGAEDNWKFSVHSVPHNSQSALRQLNISGEFVIETN